MLIDLLKMGVTSGDGKGHDDVLTAKLLLRR